MTLNDFQRPFFIGIAGSGMSAIAQYIHSMGKHSSGSDRFFKEGEFNDIRNKLEAEGISCFEQNAEGITPQIDLVIVSTAVEDTVIEVQKAKRLNIPIITRAEMLALIVLSRKSIAIGGTSGKSTTSAMLFDILQHAGLDPGIISGAGLTRIINEGKIGNAWAGNGDWLVIEADESDGSIVKYKPEIGLLLNIDKDHKEVESLMEIFQTFKNNSKEFIVNQSHSLARTLSQDLAKDFSIDKDHAAAYRATDFFQQGFEIHFKVNETAFKLNAIGKHNMENAMGAIAVARFLGIDIQTCSDALENYQGIYRRNQVLGQKNGVWIIDDFAHNPVKCAAAIRACQPLAKKVIAWFQPHGYGPTKFLRKDFVTEIGNALRADDEIWMSEIFYAGGTTTKDISSNDLISDLRANGKNAFFIEDRNEFPEKIRSHIHDDSVILLMGARDPSLEQFAKFVWDTL
jgi:UDP-N-acetylmuramate--alanine ligase